MKIGNASLLLKSTNTTLNPTISLSNEDETLTLHFVPSIPVGDAELHLHFGGELNDKLKGFYRSKCTGYVFVIIDFLKTPIYFLYINQFDKIVHGTSVLGIMMVEVTRRSD